jgi:hypothetical protein
MALTLSTADAALKELYLGKLRLQLNDDVSPTLTQLERTSENVEGRRVVLSVHYGRNASFGSAGEGDPLPVAGNQSYLEERISLRYHYGRIQFNGPVIRAMKSDKGSFVRAIESETQRLLVDAQQVMGRQVFNDANQTMARCGTTTASTEIILHSTTTATQMRNFVVGQRIDVGTLAAPTADLTGATITAVNRTPGAYSITTATAITTDASDYVWAHNGKDNEINGLQEIVDSAGTLFNINPTTYDFWKSYEDAVDGTLTENVIMTALDNIIIESGMPVKLAVTSHGVIRAFHAQLQSQKRYVGESDTLKGGIKGLAVSSGNQQISLMADRFCPEQTLFLLNTDHLKFYQSADWEWMQEDGNVLSRVTGFDAYEATLFTYRNLMTDRRNVHGKLTGITEA